MGLKKSVFLFIIFSFGFGAAFLVGYSVNDWLHPPTQNFEILNEAYSILQNHAYGDPPGARELEHSMIQGMISAYKDPYTVFLEPSAHELQSDNLRGEFGGIGVRLEQNLIGETLLYPIPESPAEQAGIIDKDKIISINGKPLDPKSVIEEIQAELRGPIGSEVNLKVFRPTENATLDFQIKRASFTIPSTSWNLDADAPKLGIIQITYISESTPNEIQNAITDLVSQGAEWIVLDLRNNPGGLLDAGVKSAKLFLREGVVIEQQYKDKPIESFSIEKPGPFTEVPLVVIVNEGTASSAELLAGALKTHHRAIVFGQPTYGKDTLQLIFELQDQSSIHVTAAKWWVPGLNPPIAGNGIQPDVLVDFNTSTEKPEIQAILKAISSDP